MEGYHFQAGDSYSRLVSSRAYLHLRCYGSHRWWFEKFGGLNYDRSLAVGSLLASGSLWWRGSASVSCCRWQGSCGRCDCFCVVDRLGGCVLRLSVVLAVSMNHIMVALSLLELLCLLPCCFWVWIHDPGNKVTEVVVECLCYCQGQLQLLCWRWGLGHGWTRPSA